MDSIPAKYIDDRFFSEIFSDEIYRDAKHKDVIVDLGALSGEFGLYMYDQARKIHCVEPCKSQFEELVSNIKDYDSENKMVPYRLAISNINGSCKLFTGVRGGASIIGQTEQSEDVECLTLNTFLENNDISHVDILKVDVESAEDLIFSSLDFHEASKKIDYIIGEQHTGRSVKDLLSPFGYNVEVNNELFIAIK